MSQVPDLEPVSDGFIFNTGFSTLFAVFVVLCRLTQLDPELARSVVRKRATAEFGEPQEDVDQPTGRCYRLAVHPYFERFTMSVIFLNAMWISVDIEFNRAEILSEADAGFIVVENLFCLFFSFELIVRLWTYTRKCSALRDIWFLFDVFLVTLMSFETWLVPLAHAITRTTGDTMTGGASAPGQHQPAVNSRDRFDCNAGPPGGPRAPCVANGEDGPTCSIDARAHDSDQRPGLSKPILDPWAMISGIIQIIIVTSL